MLRSPRKIYRYAYTFALTGLVSLAAPAGRAQGAPALAVGGEVEALGLRLDASLLPGLAAEPIEHSQIRSRYRGKLGSTEVDVTLWVFSREKFRFSEPDALGRFLARTADGGGFEFDEFRFVDGAYGFVPYAVVGRAPYAVEGKPSGERHHLFGILEDHCYQVRVLTQGKLAKKHRKLIAKFLEKGVGYKGNVRNWSWTDEEAIARWREHTPAKIHKQLKIKRTKHYIILYNAGGNLFARKMEEFYKSVQKVFPFPEVAKRRLMPVFLFRTNEQYYGYYASVANKSRASAARSKGHAWRDYYATYYESPNDPVHIHEATHQIFKNRLNLNGGGSWYQEGVADYMSEKKNTIKASVRDQIRSNEFMRLKKLMVVPSLLGTLRGSSIRGGSRANAAYLQSASVIYFLRHDKFGRARFLEFIHAMGKVSRGDLKGIEAVLQRVYQVDIDGLEARWKKYWRR